MLFVQIFQFCFFLSPISNAEKFNIYPGFLKYLSGIPTEAKKAFGQPQTFPENRE